VSLECPKCRTNNPDSVKFCGECGSSLELDRILTKTLETPKEELTTGSVFAGRYQIIEELGKGGMGKVYRAIDKKLNEQVALKLIKPEISSSKKTIERFHNELKLARKISHRNVGRMFHLGDEQGTHYITMEYVPGEDLRSMIRMSGQLGIGTAISIAKQICAGLSEAHSLGIIHRDLKPSNIMIDKKGQARIMDFGIARSLKAKGITGAGVIIGTPQYMSPEQVEAKEIDLRSDIYSLGIILYEMLTGRVPFEGDTALAIGIKHKTEIPAEPKGFNPRIPDNLSQLILKCLAKEKEKRYQSAGEVSSELAQIEGGLPEKTQLATQKKPLTSKEITVSFSAKKIFAAAALFLVFLAIGIGIWQVFLKKSAVPIEQDKHSIAVLPFEDLSLQKDQAPICDQMMIEINRKLNRLNKFDVRSRFLVKPLAVTGNNPGVIGEGLGVDVILVGSIQFDRENINVDVELLRVADKKTLWADNFLQKSDEIFFIQNKIVEQIVNILGMELSRTEKVLLSRKPTNDLEAYKLYALGRWFYDKRTPEGFLKAIEYFQQAINLDPNYALAYSGLADVYMLQYMDDKKTIEKAREAAQKALELADTLAEAYTSRANIRLVIDWDFKGAEADFRKAFVLNPNYVNAHHWYSRLLTMLGRHEEAIAEMEQALELNPTDLSSNRNFVYSLICARAFDRALVQARKTYAMDPDFPEVKDILFLALCEKYMFQEMLELYEYDEESIYVLLAKLFMHAQNNREEAVKMLDASASMLRGFEAAWAYAKLEEPDKVFEHLERSYKNRYWRMPFFKADPNISEYQSDPRFKALLKKMGLE